MLMFFTVVSPALATAGLSCQEIFKAARSSPSVVFFKKDDRLVQQFDQTGREDRPEETRFKMKYLSQYFFHRDLVFKQQLLEPEKIFPQTYKVRGENPFLGYLVAREKMFTRSLDEVLTIEGLSEAHRDLLQAYPEGKPQFLGERSTRNSEGTSNDKLGQIRDFYVGFNFLDSELATKPLTFLSRHSESIQEESPSNIKELLKKNHFLNFEDGRIEYGDIRIWRKFSDRLSPALKRRLKNLSELSESQENELRKEVLRELTQSTLDRLIRDLRYYQDSSDAIFNLSPLYMGLALFMRDFVSIHPFANGNGRLSRLVVERVLKYFGLASPIWTYPDLDVTLSVPQLARVLEDSIILSANLGQAYRRSPSRFIEEFNHGVSMAVLPLKVLYDRDHSEFDPIPMNRSDFENFRSSCSECRTDSQALSAYLRWKVVEAPEYDRPGALQIIPREFINGFAQPIRSERERQTRLDQFYRPNLMYRGMVTEEKISLDTIIRHFTHVVDSTAGMGVRATPASMKNAMMDFNQDLSKIGKLKKRYEGHLLANVRYWDSKLSSWSLEYDIGRSYQRLWENLDKKRGYGILISAKVPLFGAVQIDKASAQLKIDNPYPTEKEVSVVGGVEPLAIENVIVEQTVRSRDDHWLEGPQKIFAERLDFNTLKVTIFTTHMDPSRPAAWRLEDSFRVRLNPDGSYRRMR